MRTKYQPEFALFCALAIVTSLLLGYTVIAKGWSPALAAAPYDFLVNFFGGPLFFTPFMVIAGYLAYKWSEMRHCRMKDKKLPPRRLAILRDILTYLLFVGVFCSLFALSVKLIYLSASADWTAQASQALMSLDHSLFGKLTGGEYPAFAFNGLGNIPLLEKLVLVSYTELMTLMGLLFGILFAFHPRLLRQFVLAIFLSAVFALPVWTILPAVSPHHLYRKNIFDIEVPADIETAIKTQVPSPNLEGFLEASDLYWLDPSGQFYPVSSNPSMHMSWAVIILVYGWVFASWAGQRLAWGGPQFLWAVLILPWFILNTIGTIYAIQHYAVDLFLGVIIAVLAIRLVSRALPVTGNLNRSEPPGCWLLVKEDLVRYLRHNTKKSPCK